MSASSPRRLLLLLLVVGLAFPSHAAAAPWDFGNLLAKAGGFFSALWAPVGYVIEPDGRYGEKPIPVSKEVGCEIMPDGNCASTLAREKKNTPVLSDVGCEILPGGLCGG
ncbi:MAG TPA: hypothetical protein VGS22_24390 [Thermoanaerobaculia bacterium]|jgi:hypothetical protein|nr:hypothetical protein [Thermoanaerobaculia bacterium]